MLIFWLYTSHFKLILGNSSYLKSLHKGYFLKNFFTLWNTRILEKIHLAIMYISISVPKSQIRSLCACNLQQKWRRFNSFPYLVFSIPKANLPRVWNHHDYFKAKQSSKFTSYRPQICLTQGKMFSPSLDETIPIEKKKKKKTRPLKIFSFLLLSFLFWHIHSLASALSLHWQHHFAQSFLPR